MIVNTAKVTEMESIFAFGIDVWTAVEQIQHRAKARTLDYGDVLSFISDLLDAVDWCREHGLHPSVLDCHLDGGAVPNSYKYRATSTSIRFINNELAITRSDARSCSGGDHGACVIRIRRPDCVSITELKHLGCYSQGGYWHLPKRQEA